MKVSWILLNGEWLYWNSHVNLYLCGWHLTYEAYSLLSYTRYMLPPPVLNFLGVISFDRLQGMHKATYTSGIQKTLNILKHSRNTVEPSQAWPFVGPPTRSSPAHMTEWWWCGTLTPWPLSKICKCHSFYFNYLFQFAANVSHDLERFSLSSYNRMTMLAASGAWWLRGLELQAFEVMTWDKVVWTPVVPRGIRKGTPS